MDYDPSDAANAAAEQPQRRYRLRLVLSYEIRNHSLCWSMLAGIN